MLSAQGQLTTREAARTSAGQRHQGHGGTLSETCPQESAVTHRPSQPGFRMLTLKLPRLLSAEQVPQEFHEQGILFGYRHPQSSAAACVLSLFQMTNETLNIWTHLLPFCFFTWRFVSVLRATDILNDSYSWPLLVYMGASCVYPLASSCAHTFSCMSGNARHICYFLDYGAVSLFSLGSAIAYSAYVFPDSLVCSTFHDYYVGLAVLSAVTSTGLSCYSRTALCSRRTVNGQGGWFCGLSFHALRGILARPQPLKRRIREQKGRTAPCHVLGAPERGTAHPESPPGSPAP
ncbi:membrane progestin receptor gamma isoform X6 [Vicugna pacos]|uniref:Membrane progestin receptor gamma isoform X6 n=1 Tax=Vicugna pacos TaxID=30538 RepID=A0ABM5CF36_VICPA